jgi:NhaA family Na+:H+ antiporter
MSGISVKLAMARLPTGGSWNVIFGAGCLAGIGFTMALFITRLALRRRPPWAGTSGIPVGATGVTR